MIRTLPRLFLLTLLAFVAICAGHKHERPPQYDAPERVIDAIISKESSGRGSDTPKGDNGKALGPGQIWEVYWKDATDFDKSIGGKYEDCINEEYARKVIKAYLRKYVEVGGKYEDTREAAMVHNAGPSVRRIEGSKKPKEKRRWENANAYWRDLQKNHLKE